MNDEIFDLIEKKGPEAVIGMQIEVSGVQHEVISIEGIGDEMIVYNLRNLQTMKENHVLKIPRARPGSPEYEKLMRSYELAMEKMSEFIPPTQFVRAPLTKKRSVPHKESRRMVEGAIKELQSGRVKQANEILDRALELSPDDVYALHNKGVVLCAEEKYDEALFYFEKVLEKDPNDTDALTNRGLVLFHQKKDLEGAFESFHAVLEADPKYVEGWIGMGLVLGNIGRLEEAAKCFEKAIDIDPMNQKAKNYLEQTHSLQKKKKSE